MPSSSIASVTAVAAKPIDKGKAKPAGGVVAVKEKEVVPCTFPFYYHLYCGSYLNIGNVSPYSTGMPGASLTSTSVDPQLSASKLVWDEVR